MTARDKATMALTVLLERFTPRSEWRHTDVSEIVDWLIEAAQEPAPVVFTYGTLEEPEGFDPAGDGVDA